MYVCLPIRMCVPVCVWCDRQVVDLLLKQTYKKVDLEALGGLVRYVGVWGVYGVWLGRLYGCIYGCIWVVFRVFIWCIWVYMVCV